MNQDLEKLINEIVEQRVNERLRQERQELLQLYKDLIAYKKSTYKLFELVHPLYLSDHLLSNVRIMYHALEEIREYTDKFELIEQAYDKDTSELFTTRKRLKEAFEKIEQTFEGEE